MKTLLLMIVFSPLLSAFICGVVGSFFSKVALKIMGCGLLFIAALGSWILFFRFMRAGGGLEQTLLLSPWFSVGGVTANWVLHVDMLSVVMMLVVTSVSALVHLYSTEYMSSDPGFKRFMAYLGLFTFMMLMLVCAEDMVQLFFGWEGVGVCSYLLIGFWSKKDLANQAAIKAFLVNRVGDLFLVMGLGCLYWLTGTLHIADGLAILKAAVPAQMTLCGISLTTYDLLGLLLFIGAMGKSAQLGLHTWLPDAMEGPTPVSALIHAATMVTAGVFLVVKMSPLYVMAPLASLVITWVGGITAFVAGTIAITQTDIKRVIAYSTCSQLGYMFLGVGVGAFNGAIFHLMTHGFFKALLFLGAGAVIHGMSHEQDMFKMGGLMTKMKVTFVCMFVGSLALVGLPIFSGYYSKEAILMAVLNAEARYGIGPYVLGIGALILTALYSARLLALVFMTPSRNEDEAVTARIHEPGMPMMLPLVLLTVGAIVAGFLGEHNFLRAGKYFWGQALVAPLLTHGKGFSAVFPTLVASSGFFGFMALYYWWPQLPTQVATRLSGLYSLFKNKWFFDRLYGIVFMNGALRMGHFFWHQGDQGIIDRFGLDGAKNMASNLGHRAKTLQTGFIGHYMLAIILGFGLLALITLMMVGRQNG